MKKFILVAVIGIFTFLFNSSNTSNPEYLGTSDTYDYEEPITSKNWVCMDDCSGHEAGYEWASEHGIYDPDDCGGNSESFIEGCQAWANEQIEAQEYEGRDFWEDSADRY